MMKLLMLLAAFLAPLSVNAGANWNKGETDLSKATIGGVEYKFRADRNAVMLSEDGRVLKFNYLPRGDIYGPQMMITLHPTKPIKDLVGAGEITLVNFNKDGRRTSYLEHASPFYSLKEPEPGTFSLMVNNQKPSQTRFTDLSESTIKFSVLKIDGRQLYFTMEIDATIFTTTRPHTNPKDLNSMLQPERDKLTFSTGGNGDRIVFERNL